ncbi:CHAP domain-containing protein [Bifidobacterium scardovii]|jgi:hypothetical protein|uniref:CHAP domain-containing protein n=2 Tax=Bifidobacterium scardovii TaxID=158787 RepID=UPI00069CC2E1|nr:CHAP domain-containing protein [Bifidobacterium scardovii]MBS6948313.1 CHAP domain-containing protein [Bifidobacterium scardovii]MDU3737564.1 CHAP domain-containing protein [Bifidobacterium scardovii]MDU5610292.1 CHAP domain-containing protein [Bifidobacterium scardovii]DAO75385.1 MAG TPA: LYSK, ENDOLYSIN, PEPTIDOGLYCAN, PROTEASE [Caudoviricetes sp.]
MTRFDDWYARHVNRGSDMDGAYGTQCWDLWANYCAELWNIPQWATNTSPTGPDAGLAGSIYENWPLNTTIGRYFTRLPAGVSPQKGDVAFWARDAMHPVTHVAVVIQDGVHSGRIHVLAQNVDASMLARDMWDTPASNGYLRPNDKTPLGKENTMALTDQEIMRLWTHKLPCGRPARDIISDATSDVIRIHDTMLPAITNALNDRTDYAGDGRENTPACRISWIDRRVRELVTQTIPAMQATLAAQTEAINALAKAHGANPADIANIVDRAVRDRLNELKITVTDKED